MTQGVEKVALLEKKILPLRILFFSAQSMLPNSSRRSGAQVNLGLVRKHGDS
jgi:hypothetical protein